MNNKQSTDALELLRAQHEEVESLIEDLEASDDPSEKAALFGKLADQVAAHAAIEEQLFYPAVMAKQTRELLIESTEEHLAIKRVIADLLELDVSDEHFAAKLTVVKELIRHHAHDEEEDKLFPLVEKVASKDELAALGGEMLALFEALLEEEPRLHVPQETHAAAPL